MKFNLKAIPADLITVKQVGKLKVVKYARKVFYDNLWEVHPLLKECRGLVLDLDNNVVAHPFTKVFNIGENGTGYPEFPFTLVDKVNGFLGVITRYEGRDTFSTTGSLDSPFVTMWRDSFVWHWKDNNDTFANSLILDKLLDSFTLMFEVCHTDDPHIVKEEPGIYLIGARRKDTGTMMLECELDILASNFKWYRKEHRLVKNKEELDSLVKNCKMEGFMVRDFDGRIVAKVKSPHYLGTKFIARGGSKKTARLWGMEAREVFNLGLEEEFLSVIEKIRGAFSQEEWTALGEQERIRFVELVLTLVGEE